ncbi:TPA: hypothetical protein U0614_000347 [Streptococcus suis]|nr:hypothetical protein [Streptococcus suis]
MVEELNAIVDSNDGGMYKEVVGTENISKERNIVWFGSKKPSSHNIVLNNDTNGILAVVATHDDRLSQSCNKIISM